MKRVSAEWGTFGRFSEAAFLGCSQLSDSIWPGLLKPSEPGLFSSVHT